MTAAPPECGVVVAAVVDAHYPASGGARGAVVVCPDPTFTVITKERVVQLVEVAPYEPGRFYLRELPVLRAVLDGVEDVGLLVVDGYVDPAPGRPGLGAYCHEELGVPVIGIAKTPFRGAAHAAEVRRGGARRPLHVTAAGLPQADAARIVGQMAGRYRLPGAVRRADSLARGVVMPSLPPREGPRSFVEDGHVVCRSGVQPENVPLRDNSAASWGSA